MRVYQFRHSRMEGEGSLRDAASLGALVREFHPIPSRGEDCPHGRLMYEHRFVFVGHLGAGQRVGVRCEVRVRKGHQSEWI